MNEYTNEYTRQVTLEPYIPLLIGWLRTGRIDACLSPPPIDDDEGLTIEPLIDEDCVIALPQEHALAKTGSASLASLAKETFVICYRAFSPTMYDSILAACDRAGFSPKIGQEVAQAAASIPLVAAGFGISIVPRSFSELRIAGVTYIDIEEDAPRSEIVLVFRRDERSSAVRNVMKAVRLNARQSRKKTEGGVVYSEKLCPTRSLSAARQTNGSPLRMEGCPV